MGPVACCTKARLGARTGLPRLLGLSEAEIAKLYAENVLVRDPFLETAACSAAKT